MYLSVYPEQRERQTVQSNLKYEKNIMSVNLEIMIIDVPEKFKIVVIYLHLVSESNPMSLGGNIKPQP